MSLDLFHVDALRIFFLFYSLYLMTAEREVRDVGEINTPYVHYYFVSLLTSHHIQINIILCKLHCSFIAFVSIKFCLSCFGCSNCEHSGSRKVLVCGT